MLVECVPNFSEGRDPSVVEALRAAASSVTGAALLDTHSDPDHNRTVLTLAGIPRSVSEAVFQAAAVAVERIDLTGHVGVHPRIGAVDVIPFVPLEGAGLESCVELAAALGERLAAELELPVYLYAQAARSPERARLPWIRKPGFEGLADALASTERAPDLGPNKPHPTAGAVAVGARGLMLAFNVDLATTDLGVARKIAKKIRESSGGLPGVQAKGLELESQGRVQVSMNLHALDRVGPGSITREIARLAEAEQVEIAASELVGLMPRVALVNAGQHLLQLREPLGERVLEDRLEAALVDPSSFPRYLEALAGAAHDDPGGGSAAALALALGRACLQKVIALSRGGRGELSDADLDTLEAALPDAPALVDAARQDHAAFAALMTAWRLPKSTPGRKAAIRATRPPAVEIPEHLIDQASTLAEAGALLAEQGNPHLRNDAVAGAELALAAARVARLNARANQTRKTRRDYPEAMQRLEDAAARARAAAE